MGFFVPKNAIYMAIMKTVKILLHLMSVIIYVVRLHELEEAENIVLNKHKPVCINKDGISVLDDVGGLSGFVDFLGVIYEGEDKEESANARAWAKSLGWSDRKVSNKMMP
jgi:hypothetical protein